MTWHRPSAVPLTPHAKKRNDENALLRYTPYLYILLIYIYSLFIYIRMKRYCQTLDLREDPELIRQYRELHSPQGIWPEILQGIRDAGVQEMEIWLRGTRLFMIVELPDDADFDEVMAKMGTMPRQTEWEALTAKFQQAAENASSAEKWQRMEQIFRLY